MDKPRLAKAAKIRRPKIASTLAQPMVNDNNADSAGVKTTSPAEVNVEDFLLSQPEPTVVGKLTQKIAIKRRRETPLSTADTVVLRRTKARHAWTANAIRVLIAAGIVALTVLGLIYSPLMAVKNINIKGNSLASSDTITKTLHPFIGMPLAFINKEQVLKKLAEIPQIKSVAVQASPPNTVTVDITERKETAVIEADGKFITIDPSGVELRTINGRNDAQLPVIPGGRAAISQPSFTMLSEVMLSLDPDVLKQVDQISALSANAAQLTLKNGAKVEWGDASQSYFKGKVMQVLLSNFSDKGVTEYNVSVPDRPSTRGGPTTDAIRTTTGFTDLEQQMYINMPPPN